MRVNLPWCCTALAVVLALLASAMAGCVPGRAIPSPFPSLTIAPETPTPTRKPTPTRTPTPFRWHRAFLPLVCREWEGGGPGWEETPTPTPSVPPLPTATPSGTPTPTVEPTQTPTRTPTPSPSPTPVPTPTWTRTPTPAVPFPLCGTPVPPNPAPPTWARGCTFISHKASVQVRYVPPWVLPGTPTASGEPYDPSALRAALGRDLLATVRGATGEAWPTIRLVDRSTGRKAVVKVNDILEDPWGVALPTCTWYTFFARSYVQVYVWADLEVPRPRSCGEDC
jgi:hypothetical protein